MNEKKLNSAWLNITLDVLIILSLSLFLGLFAMLTLNGLAATLIEVEANSRKAAEHEQRIAVLERTLAQPSANVTLVETAQPQGQ